MADTLTISAAARICHCDRRTLQRAIHAGRLHLDAQQRLIGKYLSRLGPLDYVIIPKKGFETQLGTSSVPIPRRMSTLGMTRQRRDGGL